jgi:uncharacterized protein (TIGR02145 family)
MSNTKYDAIWVPGSFFEKGHWKLTPKTGDSGFGALIVLILVIFIACIVILISPLIISLIGFSLIKGKRYYAGIFSFIALLYLFIDYQKQWITSFIIFGTKQENFTNGILGVKYAPHFFIINSVAFGIAIYFIVSSCFINLKKSNDDLNSIDNDKNLISIALGLLFGVLCFYFINDSHPSLTSIAIETTVDLKDNSPNKVSPSENYEMANAPAAEETIVDSTSENSETSQDYTTNMANVTIGNQIWISKNLDVSEFNNGDPIHEAKNANEWKNFVENKEPAWSYLFYDSTNKRVGKIYNWYAVFDSRGLAPLGWHIPDIDEWHNLINYLGGKEKAMNKILGEKWTDYVGGNYKKIFNESNFNAIFGGEISYNDNLKKEKPYFILNNSFWWSSETPREVQFTGYPEISKFTKTIKILEDTDNYFLYDNENASEGSGGYVRCVKN